MSFIDKKFVVGLFLGCCMVCSVNALNKVGMWNLETLFNIPAWEKTDIAPVDGLTSLFYRGVSYKGKMTKVFAYYGTPKGKAPKGGWPAVVCVPGGGSSAIPEWVKMWNSHGYAAICMDVEGHTPVYKSNDKSQGFISSPIPGPARRGLFNDYGVHAQEQWGFQAVAQILRGHSLVRSFPEINPNKIGLTGISFGGILSSIVMGVDSRFKFAINIYGSGYFVDSDGHITLINAKGKHATVVRNYYDGAAYFKNVTCPVLWINGANDKHYSLAATQQSALSLENSSIMRIEPDMKHSHYTGWSVRESYAFADSVVKTGSSLIQIDIPEVEDGALSAMYTTFGEVVKAQLHFTCDLGPWPKRKWQSIQAAFTDSGVIASIPDGATAAYFSVTDDKGMMVSSHYIEFSTPN